MSEVFPGSPTYSEAEVLNVRTIAFGGFPIASFGMKPKDRGESVEPLTDNDVFIETVWSSGVNNPTGRITSKGLVLWIRMIRLCCRDNPIDFGGTKSMI